jgi:glutamate racemase
MIGIFDSGSGGLTVLKAIREVLPSADVLYLGDIARAPYGSRSHEELSRYTMEALMFLEKRGVSSLVSACNSVSASLALSLFDTLDMPGKRIVEMVGPTVSSFRGSKARLLLVATPATIRSSIYQNAFTMIGKECDFLAIDGLAAGIEFGASDLEIQGIIDSHLTEKQGTFDVLILACTHFPLAQNAFEQSVGMDVHLFDPALAVAERVERRFWPQEAGNGSLTFAVTKESDMFHTRVTSLFGENPRIELVTL